MDNTPKWDVIQVCLITCSLVLPRFPMKPHPIQRANGCALLLGLLLPLHQGAAQFVDLTAKLEVYQWSSKAETPWTARCVVGTNSWLIEGDFLANGRVTWWFTGTNLIRRDVITKEMPGSGLKVGNQQAVVVESADGNPGRPAGQGDLLTMADARICWLAFCSGSCLKREGRQIFPPSDLWKELIRAPSGFSDRTTVFEDSLGLPKSVTLSTTKGQPVLQYRVTASTNVLGCEFPLEFHLVQYRPVFLPESHRFDTNGWEADFTVKGRVTHIGAGAEPEIPGDVMTAIKR